MIKENDNTVELNHKPTTLSDAKVGISGYIAICEMLLTTNGVNFPVDTSNIVDSTKTAQVYFTNVSF